MLGIMQGRLSQMNDDKIQSFPKLFWESEFFIAKGLKIDLIEWTLDYHDIMRNPLICNQQRVLDILNLSGVGLQSITYDAAMQKPLIMNGVRQNQFCDMLKVILEKVRSLGIKILVLPLVDNSSLKCKDYDAYVKILSELSESHLDEGLSIAIESDFSPNSLCDFINDINSSSIGVNYDTGNSTHLGYDFEIEMQYLRSKIINIHLKDRLFKGTTVPLGKGDTPLFKQLKYFKRYMPDINIIIQAARCLVGNDVGKANEYLKFIRKIT